MSAEVDVSFMDWVASCDVGIRVASQLTLPTAPSPVTTHCREKDVSIQHCDGQPKGGTRCGSQHDHHREAWVARGQHTLRDCTPDWAIFCDVCS